MKKRSGSRVVSSVKSSPTLLAVDGPSSGDHLGEKGIDRELIPVLRKWAAARGPIKSCGPEGTISVEDITIAIASALGTELKLLEILGIIGSNGEKIGKLMYFQDDSGKKIWEEHFYKCD